MNRIFQKLVFVVIAMVSGGVMLSAKPKPRQFTILGNQIITHAVDKGVPVSAENADIRIEVTGLVMQVSPDGSGLLASTYGFTLKTPLTLRGVMVEDVSNAEPILLVEDKQPLLSKGNYWRGDAASVAVSAAVPTWLHEPGDTWRVFRFRILTAEKGALIFLQPSVIGAASKASLLALMEKSKPVPPDEILNRFMKSAAALVEGKTEFGLMTLTVKPNAGSASQLFEALKAAKKSKLAIALAAESADWAYEVVAAALVKAKKGQFKKQALIVVARNLDVAKFKDLAVASGLTIKAGPLLE